MLVTSEEDRQAFVEAGVEVEMLPQTELEIVALHEEGVAEVTILHDPTVGRYPLLMAQALADLGFEVSRIELSWTLGAVHEVWREIKALPSPQARHDLLRELIRGQPFEVIQPTPPPMLTSLPEGLVALKDFLAGGAPPISWVVEDLIAAGNLIVVAGRPGGLKTWIALDLAISTAAGEDWLGVFSTAGRPVLFVDAENGPILLQQRLSGLLAARGHSSDLPFFIADGRGLDLTRAQDQAKLSHWVHVLQPGLVILDNLRRLHSADENSSKEMAPVLGSLKRLATDSGVAIVFVHHLSKGVDDLEQAIRGTGDIDAIVDGALGVEKKGHNHVTVRHLKARWSEPVPDFDVRLAKGAADQIRLEYVPSSSGTKLAAAQTQILALLSRGPARRQDILADLGSTGISDRTAADALASLKAAGKVATRKVGREVAYELVP
jgi:DNA-binding transcriptional ArsR family regulator